ncbi:hypothetical protein ACPCSP_20200 [Streptomyces cinereoruber]|uniref:hypothetical protein n=1 Tax=Streptomyces cinereoruber TaxID=67260 RepID=UPI003C2FC00C
MSLYPIIWAAEHAPVVDAEERAILMALVMKGDFDGLNCFRSYKTLAKVARVDEKTAGRRCRALESRGVLKRQEKHCSPVWSAIPESQRPVIWEAMIPAEWWSAAQLADINEQRANLGRVPITPENRPALGEAPPKKERADKGTKRPKKKPVSEGEGTASPGGDPGTTSPHPQDYKSPPPGLQVPQPSESPSESPSENNHAVADAVGKSAGGFARADSGASAAGESGTAGGGSAASEPQLPPQRKSSPRPQTTKTRPRKESAGFEMVRGAVPVAVARPGTRLYPGLHRAINDLLDGNAEAGIPRRTPEQVIARMNRRWYGEDADVRAASDYRGCERCTATGCTSPRRGPDDADGCDRIKNPSSWLAAALIAQDCPDPGCEDGQIIGAGACQACQKRREEHREAARVVAEARARWEVDTETYGAARAALDAWTAAETAEERRLRQTLGATGLYGAKLDHHVQRHLSGWRDRNPKPAAPARSGSHERREATA